MGATSAVFSACRRGLDLPALIAELTGHECTPAGERLRCRCPLPDHEDSEPSCYLRTDPSDGVPFARWHCYGCQRGGDVVDLIEHVECRSRSSALRRASQLAGVDHLLDGRTTPYPRCEVPPVRRAAFAGFAPKAPARPPSTRRDPAPPLSAEQRTQVVRANSRACRHYSAVLGSAPAALAYLASRGVTPDQSKRFGLGYAPGRVFERAQDREAAELADLVRSRRDGSGIFDTWRKRLMFPITGDLDGSTVVLGFVGRLLDGAEPRYMNTRENGVYHKRATLFGWHLAREGASAAGRVVLCEGPFDVLAVDRLGLPAVATVSAALTEAQAELLVSLGCRVTIALDGDDAGRSGAERAAETLRGRGVERVDIATMPAGEDPGSIDPTELASRLGISPPDTTDLDRTREFVR